jgi:hypothetical protein
LPSNATAAEAAADVAASLERSEPPGRAKSQVAAAVAARAKIAQELKIVAASWAESLPRTSPLSA